MTQREHLLICMAEEAAEVQQAITKALRFGLDDGYPGTNRTNKEDLIHELTDFIGVLEMLNGEGILLKEIFNREQIEAKKAKVLEFIEYAVRNGTLEE